MVDIERLFAFWSRVGLDGRYWKGVIETCRTIGIIS